jgi:hypothetical protein
MKLAHALARAAILLAAATPAAHAGEEIGPTGTLNPEELTLNYYARLLRDEKPTIELCRFGYPAAKMGNAVMAREIFEKCGEAGVLAAMPWASWIQENGSDRPADPEAAAKWDQRAAEAGYSIGEFNWGLTLLRGHGVTRDPVRGRMFVDRAAAKGEKSAIELKANDYDPNSVTPDADEHRYEKPIY